MRNVKTEALIIGDYLLSYFSACRIFFLIYLIIFTLTILQAEAQPIPCSEIEGSVRNHFNLKIKPENNGVCIGPDGTNIIYLGRNSRFVLVLELAAFRAGQFPASNFEARIGDQCFGFASMIKEGKYITGEIKLNSLGPGLNIGPCAVDLFYVGNNCEIKLGSQEILAIDTTRPPKPINVRIFDSDENYYTLIWELENINDESQVKEYILEKWNGSTWEAVKRDFRSQKVRVDSTPEGAVRIVSVDCALNRSFSKELSLEPDSITRPKMVLSVRGPGSKIMANSIRSIGNQRGYTICDKKQIRQFDSGSKIEIRVAIGEPTLLIPNSGIYCWDVTAAINLRTDVSGPVLFLTLRDIPDMDRMIVGRNLENALGGQRPDQFRRGIIKPLTEQFFNRLDQLPRRKL